MKLGLALFCGLLASLPLTSQSSFAKEKTKSPVKVYQLGFDLTCQAIDENGQVLADTPRFEAGLLAVRNLGKKSPALEVKDFTAFLSPSEKQLHHPLNLRLKGDANFVLGELDGRVIANSTPFKMRGLAHSKERILRNFVLHSLKNEDRRLDLKLIKEKNIKALESAFKALQVIKAKDKRTEQKLSCALTRSAYCFEKNGKERTSCGKLVAAN